MSIVTLTPQRIKRQQTNYKDCSYINNQGQHFRCENIIITLSSELRYIFLFRHGSLNS